MDLQGKAALITGGKRIGLAVASMLAARKVDVAFTYARSRAEAEQGAALVRAAGCRAEVIEANLADACERAVTTAAQGFGRLDVLVNMASVYVKRPFDELMPADWDTVLAVDLRAAFLCARAVVPHLRKQGGGRIVNFSDWVARSGR